MSEHLSEIITVLSQRAGFEVVNQTVNENQIRIIHRISKEGMPNWLSIMKSLFGAEAQASWNLDVSKQYFLRAGSVVYGWRFILQTEEVESCLPAVLLAIKNAPLAKRANRFPEEQPLVGCGSSRRGVNAKGKGVRTIKGD